MRTGHAYGRGGASGAGATALLLVAAGCGGGGAPLSSDGGADGLAQLTLTISVNSPALDGFVLTRGELELEEIGLIGDAPYDGRSQLGRATFPLGAGPQRFVFPEAAQGLYSRLRAEIDHLEIYGTWRGLPLHLQTAGDERVVDLRGPDATLSPTQPASFQLVVDGAQWLTAATLDGVAPISGAIEIDETVAPGAIDDVMAGITDSFALTAP